MSHRLSLSHKHIVTEDGNSTGFENALPVYTIMNEEENIKLVAPVGKHAVL
jgi:hypothetical protein